MFVLDRLQLIEPLTESKRNVVLVVLGGPRNAPNSFGGKLEDLDAIKLRTWRAPLKKGGLTGRLGLRQAHPTITAGS